MGVMRIRDLRKAKGLTQTVLANSMGVTQTIVSDWEHEVYLPKARELPRLAYIFGCTINDLFQPDAEVDIYEEGA